MSWLSDAINAQTNNIGAAMTSTPHRQKVIDLRAKYNNALADVRGDSSLSELGKTQMIARAWTNTRTEIARLEQLVTEQSTRLSDPDAYLAGDECFARRGCALESEARQGQRFAESALAV